MTKTILPLVQNDSWLEPVNDAVTYRWERYSNRLKQIEAKHGSLQNFAKADEFLGFNYDKQRKGWWYREWAPAAEALYLMGDFNHWDQFSHPLFNDQGIWEIFLDDETYTQSFVHQSLFKVVVHGGGRILERIPVYAKRVVQDENTKDFSGQLWHPKKKYKFKFKTPKVLPGEALFIYESHVGMAQETESVGTYVEFRKNVLPRVAKAGYNVIQLMAIAEHPYYGSFGYHVSGFFAPSSRFGTPEELKELIDAAHQMGLLVIMDVVHSHTVKNVREGLNLFDGTDYQYTHAGSRGDHPQWDSKLFDYGKEEVQQFLLTNLRYWMEEFRFDGFRFDGVTSMMYLHHGMGVDFGKPEQYFTDGVEFDAITYLQLANELIHRINPDVISIAEDVSGMPGLCNPVEDGGLGFNFRLGMGLPDFWIKLLKDQKDEDWNISEMFHTMTNRLFTVKTIAYCESHDQALVGDKTIAFRLMDKEMYFHMAKDDQSLVIDRGMALHKMIRLFTISLGGDAWLNFMGNEFGHPEWIDFPREGNNWSYAHARRQWSLTEKDYLRYHYLQDFDRAMLELIRSKNIMTSAPPWLLLEDHDNKTLVFERNHLVFVFNWHPYNAIPDYEIPLKQTGDYRILLSSDDKCFGGFGRLDTGLHYPSYLEGDQPRMKIYNVNRAALVLERVEDF
jgi:1,4-alpha-glucan branching enzyme